MFLPKDYKAPKSSNYYAKLMEGENKFRILSQPILGWEDWVEKKPMRYRMDAKPLKSHDPKKPMRHFWSMIVWNYNEELIQILHITQASIRNSIEALCNDNDWGAPYFYDLKIIKSGDGMDTEYMINPLPHKPLGEHIQAQFMDKPCNLEALYDGADPFSTEWSSFTPGVFSKEATTNLLPKSTNLVVEKKSADTITAEQAKELAVIIKYCQSDYQEELWKTLRGLSVTAIDQVPKELFPRILAAATKKRDEYQKMIAEIPF